ncbi:SoxR reducing system RseC family protein [Methylocucumis oryzae]|uniref:Positive regulator of sigma E, RseC/MucC n=1 Tax=Methylocucumis oryzae TaxID=1632867 RepID=A0A0F3IG98_9GAMM|nr:SoxR reducing system RseC family protein [Methylocucumis oryzae]KJV05712.1 positive regulator of sigma E, RseC/MucC [Methylocucumis oryzae]
MIEEIAIVVKTDEQQTWVNSCPESACGGCAQKSGCTSHALSSVLRNQPIPVDSAIPLHPGDHVVVAVDEQLLLCAALVVYVLPLLALFFGIVIADTSLPPTLPYRDLSLAGLGLLVFLTCLIVINRVQHVFIVNVYTRPVVVKKL